MSILHNNSNTLIEELNNEYEIYESNTFNKNFSESKILNIKPCKNIEKMNEFNNNKDDNDNIDNLSEQNNISFDEIS